MVFRHDVLVVECGSLGNRRSAPVGSLHPFGTDDEVFDVKEAVQAKIPVGKRKPVAAAQGPGLRHETRLSCLAPDGNERQQS